MDDVGYKILTENTVAVTNRAQYPQENLVGASGGDSKKEKKYSPLIAYIYHDMTYTGEVVIPETVTYDGITYVVTKIEHIFSSTKHNVTSLIIEDGDTELYIDGGIYSTFYYQAIETLYLGRNITGNTSYTFGHSLKTITIGDNVTTLGAHMFDSCEQLTTVHFGKNIASMGESVFIACTSLLEIDLSESKLSVVPETTFYNCTALTSVVLPQGLTIIGERAFYGCSSLNSINFPQGLMSISSRAFYGAAFSQLRIPNSVTYINKEAFGTCTQLINFIIEDGDNELTIGNNENSSSEPPFKNCPIDSLYLGRNLSDESDFSKNIRALAFGDKVTKTGYWRGCTNLTSVYFGKNISSTVEYAFAECASLKHIDMTSYLGAVFYRTFYNCTALENIILPANATYLGGKLFEGCTSLKSITIPGTVTEMGYYAFDGCTSLKEVVFEDGESDLILEGYSATSTFNNCPLDSVYLGRNLVKKADAYPKYYYYYPLFPECLTKLTIGNTVSQQWDSRTFQNCTNITNIYPLWEQPIETNKNMFPDAVYSNATLVVPCGTIKNYRATAAWNQFANIVPESIVIKMMATEGGSIRLEDEVACGDTKLLKINPKSMLTFEIAADEEYYLESLTMNGEDVTAQIVDGKLTPSDLSDDLEMIATFKAKPYFDVVASASAGGSAIVDNESVMWGLNANVTLTVDEGYELVSVFVNEVDKTTEVVDGVLALGNIQENKTVIVTFQKLKFIVTAIAGENGSIQLSTDTPEWGDDVTVAITPDPHYNINKVLVNGNDKTAELVGNIFMLQDVRSAISIEATFSIQTFTVSTSANKGGIIQLSAGSSEGTETSVTAEWGSSVIVTLEVEEDYEIVSLFANGVDVKEEIVDGSYSIASVEDDIAFEAVFKEMIEITLVDGVAYNRTRDKDFETIHYSRLFNNTDWEAWYVPFDLSLTNELLSYFSFAKFAGTYTEDDGSFCITIAKMKEGDVVKANTPYCVKANQADSTNPRIITQTDVTLKAAEKNSFYMLSAEKKIIINGSYNEKVATEGDDDWYALSSGLYSVQQPGNVLSPFRCFVTIDDREDNPYASTPNPATVKLMVLGDDETGIEELESPKQKNEYSTDTWYTMDGRRLSGKPTHKGIFIINGKKVLVK